MECSQEVSVLNLDTSILHLHRKISHQEAASYDAVFQPWQCFLKTKAATARLSQHAQNAAFHSNATWNGRTIISKEARWFHCPTCSFFT